MKQIITFFFIACFFSTYAAIWYVTPTGAGSNLGTSWANAATGNNLQSIINAAAANDQVWVKNGTYTPTNTNNRNLAFSMRNTIRIYGGFAGTETLLTERSLNFANPSILSGEIGAAGIADNSFHVISNPTGINNTALIDGFIIEAANDDRSPTIVNGLGGGIYNNGGNAANICSPTIRNCLIQNNAAQFGAGIFNSGHSGGNSSPIIEQCVITNNLAYLGGGGIDNFGLAGTASPTITNCVIYANTAVQRAGGMYCWGGNNGNANPVINNSCFINNSAVDGGGIVSDRENSPSGSFSGNSNPIIYNSIFWGNTASGIGPQFFIIGSATVNATYTCIDMSNQNSPHILTGLTTGNLTTNPLLTNLADGDGINNIWFTDDDGLMPQSAASPIVGAGNNTGAPAVDILNHNRIVGTTVDMGAYEHNAAPLALSPIYLDGNSIENRIHLDWEPLWEESHSYFEIERSKEGHFFEKIASIQAAGTPNQPKHYTFIDKNPHIGINYYRLKQVDRNSYFEYSNTISLYHKQTEELTVYPQPAKETIYIGGVAAPTSYQIYTIMGELAQSGELLPQHKVDISYLVQGLYFLKINNQCMRFIKK